MKAREREGRTVFNADRGNSKTVIDESVLEEVSVSCEVILRPEIQLVRTLLQTLHRREDRQLHPQQR